MSVPSSGGGGDFRVGDVLSRAWTILTNNLLFFIGTSALVYVIMIVTIVILVLLAVTTGQIAQGHLGLPLILLMLVGFVAVIIVNMIGQAAMLFGAFQFLRGVPVRFGECVSRAMARIGPLIGVTLLTAICLMLGFILLIVPGIILFCMWAVVVPVCVVEGSGPTACMSRSAALTKGHRWKIFGIFLLLAIINGIGTQLLQLVLTPVSSVLASLVVLVASVVLAAYAHCVVIMVYHDLRVAKEGIDTTQIASVFD